MKADEHTHVLGVIVWDNFGYRGLFAGVQQTGCFGLVQNLTISRTEFGMSDVRMIGQVDVHGKVGSLTFVVG